MAKVKINQIQYGEEIEKSTYNLIDSIVKSNVHAIAQVVMSNLRYCTMEELLRLKIVPHTQVKDKENGFLYVLYNKDKIYHVGFTKDTIYKKCMNTHKRQDWFEDVTDIAYYCSKVFKNDEKILNIVKESINKYGEELKEYLNVGENNQ